MISYARQDPEQQPGVTSSPADDHIAPAPRVSVQAFCGTVETAGAVQSAGVPPRGIIVHHYHPEDPRQLATIRLTYSRIAAVAGPCGVWPEDLGPSIKKKGY